MARSAADPGRLAPNAAQIAASSVAVPAWAGPATSMPSATNSTNPLRIARSLVRRLHGERRYTAAAHGQHPLAEEADPAFRARAPREPPFHLGRQDLLPPPRGRGRRG